MSKPGKAFHVICNHNTICKALTLKSVDIYKD